MDSNSPPPSQTASCFLFLKPVGDKLPSMIDNDSAAGLAFNDALRSVAELDSFSSRPYGADARGCSYQLFGWTDEPRNSESQRRFLWVINFKDADTLRSWRCSENFDKTIRTLSPYFDIAQFESGTNEDMLLVQWTEGDAAKLLNRVNQIHRLSIGQSKEASSTDDNLAKGHTIPSTSNDQNQSQSVLLDTGDDSQSTSEATSTNEEDEYTFTLTRTKYCTRIRQDLHNAIKTRRVE